MEETPKEAVMFHHGYKEVALKFRKNGVEIIRYVVMKINEDVRKFGKKYAEDIEYGLNKERIMFGMKGHISYIFVGPAHE
jgi:hypothetical protein